MLSGIPGKMGGFDGDQVAEAWLDGDIRKIAEYNQHDAVTTYLGLAAHRPFRRFLQRRAVPEEQDLVRAMLQEKAKSPRNGHLADYIREWDRLRGGA